MNKIDKSYQIIKILKLVKGSIKHNFEKPFKDLNLTGPQSMLLGTLKHNGPMKVTELSQKMGLSNSTVSGIIDRLELQNFVVRIRNEQDRRVVMIDLHDNFKLITKEQFCSFDSKLSEIMKDAKDEELDIILKGLDTLNKILRKEEN